jgi:hypothetical protein
MTGEQFTAVLRILPSKFAPYVGKFVANRKQDQLVVCV